MSAAIANVFDMAKEITKEQLAAAVASSRSVRGVMRYLGLNESRYARGKIKRRIGEFGLDTSHFVGSTRYTPQRLEEATSKSSSVAGVMRYLGIPLSGGSHAHISRRLKAYGIDTSHFTGQTWAKGKHFPRRRPEDILVTRLDGRRTRPHLLRRALKEIGVAYICAACRVGETWMSKSLILEVDHINGNPHDNRPEHLRFLCPNCHSQTATYSGRNKGGRITGDQAA